MRTINLKQSVRIYKTMADTELEPKVYYDKDFIPTTKEKAVYVDHYLFKNGKMVIETIKL